MRLSVITPALNEAGRIDRSLRAVADQPDIYEHIVVDGGSRDDTVSRARRHPGVKVLESRRGRALQLNTGARAATGDTLLFLHMDAELPPCAADLIVETLAIPGVSAGAFRTRHQPERWRGSARAYLLRLADGRSRRTTLPYGDQGLFLRAHTFARAGGFPEIALMEDLAFSRRLRQLGRIRVAPAEIRVSGRRFESAPLRQTLMVNTFPALFALGVSPQRLAQWYGAPR
ncbi:TIGR04283 family arsenosugar biosynthesis glycosyltransferase [Haliangium sp.]|uniref:TIGR04283 family arsenosugar biosynthesis glycosyltransferase n=1 Tax=Haliangium sp. TaxID=2663208 RepID=UPI003D11C135